MLDFKLAEFINQINPSMSSERLIELTLEFIYKKFGLAGYSFNSMLKGKATSKKAIFLFSNLMLELFFNKKPSHKVTKEIELILALAEKFVAYAESLQRSKSFATTDRLTGLFNKAYFMGILKNMKARREHFCLALLDLDNFKRFNDRFGHQQGDAFLQELGKIIKENLKHGEFACRYGGEEFCIILKSNLKEAYLRIDALRKRIANINGIITASIGLVESSDSYDFTEIVRKADELMYRAKKTGKNKVCIESKKEGFFSRIIRLIKNKNLKQT
ncbi:MAG: GGDEF domain-containing protein [Candidatus Pacearchaeota archaeon]